MYIKSYDKCNTGEARYTKENLTRGGKIFLAFLFLEYILPLFMNLMYDTQPIFRLPIHSPTILFSISLLISISIIAVLAARYTPTITPRNKGPIRPLPRWSLVIVSLITIYVGYSIFSSGLTQWRYTTSISSNSTVLYASIAQMIMPVMSFWVLMTDHQLILSRSWSNILVKGLMLLAIIFSMNGLSSVFTTLLFTVVFIAPRTILGFLFNDSAKTNKKKSFFANIGLLVLLFFVIVPIFLAGVYTKSGDVDYTIEERVLAYTGVNYLVNRHSVHLSSVAASIEDGSNYTDLRIPFNTAIYRLKLSTGIDSDAEKPEISSFARLALLQFADFQKINPKGGSSPGLLAALTMVLPLPLAALAIFLATFILVKLLDLILFRQPPFSLIGAIIFAYIPLRYVTDSPLDLFIPGPVTIVLLLVLFMSFRRESVV